MMFFSCGKSDCLFHIYMWKVEHSNLLWKVMSTIQAKKKEMQHLFSTYYCGKFIHFFISRKTIAYFPHTTVES